MVVSEDQSVPLDFEEKSEQTEHYDWVEPTDKEIDTTEEDKTIDEDDMDDDIEENLENEIKHDIENENNMEDEDDIEKEEDPLELAEEFVDITKLQYQLFKEKADSDSEKIEGPETQETQEVEQTIENENDEETKLEAIQISDDADIEKKDEQTQDEQMANEEIREPQTQEIPYIEDVQVFDTALETKYSSLKLDKFPIKFSNIPDDFEFPYVASLGNTSLHIGDSIVHNCKLKIVSNDSIKILKIRNREFKLAISVSLNNDTIVSSGIFKSYEISSLIKHSRLLKVLELLEDVFTGKPISFKMNRLYGDIEVPDKIELMKINTIQDFLETLDKADCRLDLDHLPENDNLFYLSELYIASKQNKEIDSLCDFKISNLDSSIKAGDSLILKREHKFDKDITLVENIILEQPLDRKNVFKEKIIGYRKPCKIKVFEIKK